ncbi:MAG: hypothetical protein ACR2G5_08785 [Pyrinomonadaceae bacterium]
MTGNGTETSRPLTLSRRGYGVLIATSLARFFDPPLEPSEQLVGQIEGWILGVV